MKYILAATFIILLALGTACGRISPAREIANDGIKVHGEWTVTVTNSDGTIDFIQEFSNDLVGLGGQGSGADLLTALLAGETSVSSWKIYLYFDAGMRCQENSQVTNYNTTHTLAATSTRDVSEGTPFRVSATCTMDLEDTTSIVRLNKVYTGAYIGSSSFPTYGTNGPTTPGAVINFTRKDFPYSAQPELQHNQVVGLNVVITFQ